jgi:SNF1-activating kinase 1
LINQYEIIDEIGRGVHGKVKLARNLETGEYVAIKIIQRSSKKRRLGKVSVSPQDKTKREIAILKKIRHPHVVGLLEVIDDPELKKIYMVLEYVELGEVVWRKKGVPMICLYERRRIEREMRGDFDGGEEERYFRIRTERYLRKEAARAKMSRLYIPTDHWSLEHGDNTEDDMAPLSRQETQESTSHAPPRSQSSYVSVARSNAIFGPHSRATSRACSRTSSTAPHTPLPVEFGIGAAESNDDDDDDEKVGPLPSIPSNHSSAAALDAHFPAYFGDNQHMRGRSPSTADSIISHMSSVDDIMPHDIFEEDFSYVPCFTMEQARSTFRDTVLGLEYLHYEGIVHRDIKPANLLWTKDHRVKISDFGVSFFGRPIRNGETEESVSESDAQDFDDEVELAKTVGTPAFFAPELCYTDLDLEQFRVTEQIDVWSLGVTLYCLIYARIPFLAEDEYQLFKAIAQQDVYIPRRRLKAVNPSCPTPHTGLQNAVSQPSGLYREDNQLVMEDIDDELYDLLNRMLKKDPAERLTLREVKRHPWVLKGIDNWLDDTDPSRKTAGRRIQVDDRELERAVVPITFLERARSVVKKAVGKVIGRAEGSRKRAVSSANSPSGGDISLHSPSTPFRDLRRSSLRGDESLIATLREPREPADHPLAQSVTASPEQSVDGGDPFAQEIYQPVVSLVKTPERKVLETDLCKRLDLPHRMMSNVPSVRTMMRRGLSRSRSFSGSPPKATEPLPRTGSSPDTSFKSADHVGSIIEDGGRSLLNARSGTLKFESKDGSLRTRSAERALFTAKDKHGEPSVALDNVVAPGSFGQPSHVKRHIYSRSTDARSLAGEHSYRLPSPRLFRHSTFIPHQPSVSSYSIRNVTEQTNVISVLDDRPSTATRTPEGKTPSPRTCGVSNPELFALARDQLDRSRGSETEIDQRKVPEPQSESNSTGYQPIPVDDATQHEREETIRDKSSGSIDSYGLSPITSPSDMTSPSPSGNLDTSLLRHSEQFFPSDPSLPTLISGASSVSVDTEGDFLINPGVTQSPSAMNASGGTPDTLTPPSLPKELSQEEQTPLELDCETLPILADDEDGYIADGDLTLKAEDDEDSDSDDDGIIMGRRKPTAPKSSESLTRRDANASICSTDTAKMVSTEESTSFSSS